MFLGISSILGRRITQGLTIAGYVVKWSLVTHVVVEYVGCIVICQGSSMEPTLKTGDIILTDHITPRFGSGLKRGDIVVLRSPSNPTEFVCKRVVGIAGDYTHSLGGSSRKYGYGVDVLRDLVSRSSMVVPRGHIWVEGDNSTNSTDSRNYGAVPVGLVRGRAFFKLLPPSRLPYP